MVRRYQSLRGIAQPGNLGAVMCRQLISGLAGYLYDCDSISSSACPAQGRSVTFAI